jgi:DNA-binding response OmpR family regulator
MKNCTDTKQPIILLIEDEENLRRSITFTLLRQGYCVVPYDRVEEGLRIIGEYITQPHSIRLVITDLQLPGKNGMDLIRMVKTTASNIPILVITGHANQETRNELSRLGVSDILDKPFNLDELVTMVRKVLDGPPFKKDGNEIRAV